MLTPVTEIAKEPETAELYVFNVEIKPAPRCAWSTRKRQNNNSLKAEGRRHFLSSLLQNMRCWRGVLLCLIGRCALMPPEPKWWSVRRAQSSVREKETQSDQHAHLAQHGLARMHAAHMLSELLTAFEHRTLLLRAQSRAQSTNISTRIRQLCYTGDGCQCLKHTFVRSFMCGVHAGAFCRRLHSPWMAVSSACLVR